MYATGTTDDNCKKTFMMVARNPLKNVNRHLPNTREAPKYLPVTLKLTSGRKFTANLQIMIKIQYRIFWLGT